MTEKQRLTNIELPTQFHYDSDVIPGVYSGPEAFIQKPQQNQAATENQTSKKQTGIIVIIERDGTIFLRGGEYFGRKRITLR